MSSKYPVQFKIALPVIEVDTPEGKQPRNIGADVLRVVMAKVPDGGMTTDEMRKRIPLFDRLDADSKELIVSESERKFLLDLLKPFKYGVFDKNIVATEDAVVNAESCTLAPVAA